MYFYSNIEIYLIFNFKYNYQLFIIFDIQSQNFDYILTKIVNINSKTKI